MVKNVQVAVDHAMGSKSETISGCLQASSVVALLQNTIYSETNVHFALELDKHV